LSVADNVAAVRAAIAAAARRAGRDPEAVRLVAVTKGFAAEAAREAWAAGVDALGENRVQEALGKMPAIPEAAWHLVGHLQRNKVRKVVGRFALIHSVDSLRLAEAVSAAAEAARTVQPVLVQVNVAGNPRQSGVPPEDAAALVAACRRLPGLRVDGLMAIAPPVPDPEGARPFFRRLRLLAESLGLAQLSMGMSDDFPVAVEEGATYVRVGRAIFGARA
jgi:pyridoxal phosphate enzyme (YggS family)